MKKSIFSTADILLPSDEVSPELWSVIACDQFTSERDYWERVKQRVGEAPSTLNMIIPEVYLDDIDEEGEIRKLAGFMDDYINQGIFREVRDSFIYVERKQSDGNVRKGLVGKVDLEEYDFSEAQDAAILASEGTVLDRLPPRIRVRKAASLELPHIMTFIADEDNTVIEPLAEKAATLPALYDFELMEGGGHLRAVQISGSDAENVIKAMDALHEKNKALTPPQCLMIMGDGNHSLAAAKSYWNELKQNLSSAEQETHPARFALVEVNNLYDPAINFEAIHRVVFDVDVEVFISDLKDALPAGSDFTLEILAKESGGLRVKPAMTKGVQANSTSDLIAMVQEFLDDYVDRKGGRIDYIHDVDVVEKLAKEKNCAGILLPTVTKPEFFKTVSASGIFPRKSFSVGHARDKRYYMECRKII